VDTNNVRSRRNGLRQWQNAKDVEIRATKDQDVPPLLLRGEADEWDLSLPIRFDTRAMLQAHCSDDRCLPSPLNLNHDSPRSGCATPGSSASDEVEDHAMQLEPPNTRSTIAPYLEIPTTARHDQQGTEQVWGRRGGDVYLVQLHFA
jgi:hypothetical protein